MSEETLLTHTPSEESSNAPTDPASNAATTPADPPPATDFSTQIPEAFRGEKCLEGIGSVDDLVKGYVHAQKLVGADKIVAPRDDWEAEQWDEFYSKLGRPEKADEYKLPEVEMPEGLEVKAEEFSDFMETAHKAGLNQKQVEQVLDYYLKNQATAFSTSSEEMAKQHQEAARALQSEWGDGWKSRVNQANELVKQLGDPELSDIITQSGLGRSAKFVKFLAEVSDAFVEDNPRSEGKTIVLSGGDKANMEIQKLQADAAFVKRYTDRYAPGHNAAVEQMTRLQQLAAAE